MVIQYEQLIHTEYVAVDLEMFLEVTPEVSFRCSKQIANGGPVTVTHPEIIRYFYDDPRSRQSGVRSKELTQRRGNIYP